MRLSQRLAAEFAGTALLLAIVIGSGIMGERLAGGNAAIALLANSLATGCGLFVLIVVFAPFSGAHFNPLVTAGAVIAREVSVRDATSYVCAQLAGALVGAMLANVMFDLAPLALSSTRRTGAGVLLGEIVATFGLVMTVVATKRYGPLGAAAAVASFICAGYWFTSSTSFANPAVTLARSFTPTFTGIHLGDVPLFVGAQCVGALCGLAFARWITGERPA